MEFLISLADRIISVKSSFDHVYEFCKNYRMDTAFQQVDLSIIVDEYDTAQERRKSLEEGELYNYSDGYLEELAVYRKIAEAMLDNDTWLMHGSVIGVGDSAYMITAASGKGKSTLTRLVLHSDPEAFVINGDKPLLSLGKGAVFAHGTPWSGKEHMNTNCARQLKSIILLERGEVNRIQKISFGEALSRLLQQTYRPAEPEKLKKTLKLVSELGKAENGISLYRMTVRYYDDAAQLENAEVLSMLRQAGISAEGEKA